jgi:hypothetical protein
MKKYVLIFMVSAVGVFAADEDIGEWVENLYKLPGDEAATREAFEEAMKKDDADGRKAKTPLEEKYGADVVAEIPKTEKALIKFMNDLEDRADALIYAYNEREWLATVYGKDVDVAKWKELYNELFKDKVVLAAADYWRERTISDKRLARRMVLLDRETAELRVAPDLRKETAGLESELYGKYAKKNKIKAAGYKVDVAEWEKTIGREPDVEKRRDLYEAKAEINAGIVGDDLTRLLELRNDTAKELGYETYWHYKMSSFDMAPSDVERVADETVAATDEAWAELKQLWLKRNGTYDFKPWDVIYLTYDMGEAAKEIKAESEAETFTVPDGAWTPEKTLDYHRLAMSAMGIFPPPYPMYLDTNEDGNKYSFCDPVRIPTDVRLRASLGGEAAAREYYGEYGKAVHFSHINPELSFLERYGEPAFAYRGVAAVFAEVPDSAEFKYVFFHEESKSEKLGEKALGFLGGFIGMPELGDIHDMMAKDDSVPILEESALALWKVRWNAMLVKFERHLYENPEGDHAGYWNDLLRSIMLVESDPTDMWAQPELVVKNPGNAALPLLTELLASQLRMVMRTRYGTFWYDTKCTSFVASFSHPAASTAFEDKLLKITGSKLSPSYFVRERGL